MSAKMKHILISILSLVVVLSTQTFAKQEQGPTLLVVPARQAIIKLAFDVARLRGDISLVSYQMIPGAMTATLYVWNAREQDWVKISLDDYSSAGIFDPVPKQVVLIGTDAETLAAVERASAWTRQVKRVPTLDIMTIVNSLNEALTFAPSEWRYLAKRHDLKLQDLNEERRRYGKYGKPGGKSAAPMPDNLEGEEGKSAPMPPIVTTEPAEPKTSTVEEPATAPEDK